MLLWGSRIDMLVSSVSENCMLYQYHCGSFIVYLFVYLFTALTSYTQSCRSCLLLNHVQSHWTLAVQWYWSWCSGISNTLLNQVYSQILDLIRHIAHIDSVLCSCYKPSIVWIICVKPRTFLNWNMITHHWSSLCILEVGNRIARLLNISLAH